MLVPIAYQITSFVQETHDVFSFALSPKEKKIADFLPGQFNMLYLYGFGEVPISISGDPSKKEEIYHTIRVVGNVTQGLQKLKKGDEIGVRGPFGTPWPLQKKNCDVLIVAGGIGLPPLRPVLFYLAKNREQYKKITLLYGARTPEDIVYKNELALWKEKGVNVEITVDVADTSWQGNVGVVTALVHKHLTSPKNSLALICGPEIMIKFAINELMRKEMDENDIHVSMERNMECAVGFCGHCQYGPFFLCKDGPVFSYKQLKHWLPIKEL